MGIDLLDEFRGQIDLESKTMSFPLFVGRPFLRIKIIADRGTQFTSKKWKEVLKEREMELILTSIRHPQANMFGRVNRELARFFMTFLPADRQGSWYSWIEKIETILNESYHNTIEITPHEALLKRNQKEFGENGSCT